MSSALLKKRRAHGYRQQCCIGIACTQSGMPDDLIRGRAGVEDLYPVNTPEWLRRMAEWNGEHDLYDINDERNGLSDKERVAKLNRELKKRMIPMRFRLKNRTATKARDAKRAVSAVGAKRQKRTLTP
jgi:hypothetical protein